MSLLKEFQKIIYEMKRLRQKLHEEAELPSSEGATTRSLVRQLQSFGLDVHSVTKTGVVGVLHGKHGAPKPAGGKAVMFYADISGAAGTEKTDLPYMSKKNGVHHSAGHDGEMAMLLAAAKRLAQNPDFEGTVYFVFAPTGGAAEALRKGLLTKFPADEIYGLKHSTTFPLGHFSSSEGKYLPGAEDFSATLRGHGAGVTAAAGEIMVGLKAILSDPAFSNTLLPKGKISALSVQSVKAEARGDALPDEISMTGILRAHYDTFLSGAKKRLEALFEDVVFRHGVEGKLSFKPATPNLSNAKEQTEKAFDAATEIVGGGRVRTDETPPISTRDVAHIFNKVAGNLMILGTGDKATIAPLHHPKYDFNDAALPYGAAYWVTLAKKALPVKTPKPVPPPPPVP